MTGEIIPAPALVPAHMLDAINALAKAFGCAEGDPEMQATIRVIYDQAVTAAIYSGTGGKPCSPR